MILRAIFWIAVVAILMPHEPDLGFGRPGSADGLVSQVTTALKSPQACEGEQSACFAALAFIDRVKADGYTRLAQVRADIERAQADRRARRAILKP